MEQRVPRLVINYKPLNKALQWIRYPIPNKKDLLDRLNEATTFSKFDMKSGFWQIQIDEKDTHWKHLYIFVKVIKHNGLVVSAT